MVHEILRLEEVSGIHHVVMADGPNALNPVLMEALVTTLAELRERGAPPVLLRSAHEVLFSPGWDLKRLAGVGREDVADSLAWFNRVVLELFSYPGPTGAAVAGHAVAGGCLLALACDLRIMAVGRPRIGLSELNLGVPVPMTSLIMLRQRLAPDVVEEIVFRGDGCGAERARELGIVHRVADEGTVVAKTARELARLASRPAPAFAAAKRFLLDASWRRMAESPAEHDEVFLDCWFSNETQERITGLVARLGA